jgi:hypothetical protein
MTNHALGNHKSRSILPAWRDTRDPGLQRQVRYGLLACIALFVAGIFAWEPLSYFVIVIPALLPTYFWLRAGAPGLPTLPVVAALSTVYYAFPILRGDVVTDDVFETLKAALTVAAFLVAAAIVYLVFLGRVRRHAPCQALRPLDNRAIVKLAFVGLAGGIALLFALLSGGLAWLGDLVGVARSIGFTFTVIACYLLGSARASGLLRGVEWALAIGGLAALFLLSVSGLFLNSAVTNMLGFMLGYVVAGRRIPWATVIITLGVVSVLQAGKMEMRYKYWMINSQAVGGGASLPELMVDWFEEGTKSLLNGRPDIAGVPQVGLFERASLLWILVGVQQATPRVLPFLEGKTYTLLPSMLVPRFVDPDKPSSQSVLNLLSVRYGLQNVGGTASTTIGWGLIAEAWANFGFIGVVAIGIVFGALCGAITLLSCGASLASLRMLAAIAATSVLLNIEADLSYLLVTMLQTIAAVFIAGTLPMIAIKLFGQKRAPPARRQSDYAVPQAR